MDTAQNEHKPETHNSQPPWTPTDPHRWAILGLADPLPAGDLPHDATIADVLAWALLPSGTPDPIEGIVTSVCLELRVLASVADSCHVADLLSMCERRLSAAMLLLRWTDGRAKMPAGDDPPPDSEEGVR